MAMPYRGTIRHDSDTVTTVTTPPCMGCQKKTEVPLPREQVERWRGGELIQHVWPHWTPEDRELLMSGTHDDCWKQMFPDEED